jgi:two-component system, OmpR family, phosphate regulon sensor histidine kinase PhoR
VSIPLSRQMRLAGALLLLSLPLAVGVWMAGSYAAERDRKSSDQRLASGLNTAVVAYRARLADATARARVLAGSRGVQRAFLRHDRTKLAQIERSSSDIVLSMPTGAAFVPGAATRTWEVRSGGRIIGRVSAAIPLDRTLVAHLAKQVNLHGPLLIGLVRANELIGEGTPVQLRSRLPKSVGDVVAGPTTYRVAVTPFPKTHPPLRLVTMEPKAAIDAAADKSRRRVLIVGFGFMAALVSLAYFVAPGIARSRVSRHERVQAERVLAHVGDGIFLVDRTGVVRLWNPAAEAITGIRAKEVIDRPARERIPGWPAIEAMVPIASRPGDREETWTSETVPLDAAGGEVWLSMVGVALEEGIVYAFRDVTRERRLERVRAEFVATVSHELRTPLASLHGAALTLREHSDLAAETRSDLLDMIAGQSQRLADLVEEILITSQLDSGSLRVSSEPFDAEGIVRFVAEDARLRVGDERTIEVDLPPGLPLVFGDAGRTRQVLSNLVDNAAKYSPDGSLIQIIVDVHDEHVRFAVSDEGLGIPLNEQEQIFEKFYRLDPHHRRGVSGSGLGLYICRELVRSMNGRIFVESDLGRGATFTVELPVADRSPAPAPRLPARA